MPALLGRYDRRVPTTAVHFSAEENEVLYDAVYHHLDMCDEDHDPVSEDAKVLHDALTVLRNSRFLPDHLKAVVFKNEQISKEMDCASNIVREIFAGLDGKSSTTAKLLGDCIATMNLAILESQSHVSQSSSTDRESQTGSNVRKAH